jgi:hypothetical protein
MKKAKSLFVFLFLALSSLSTPSVASCERFSFRELKALAEEAGFPTSMSSTIAAISLAESSGYSCAHNDNRNTYDDSYGLMQINMINYPHYKLGESRLKSFKLTSNEDLFNPLVNMKAAKKIYDTSGLNAWSVYRHGTYKKYLP